MKNQYGVRYSFLLLFLLTFSLNALASRRSQIDQKLHEFDQDPSAFAKDIKNVAKFYPDTLAHARDLRVVSKKQKDLTRKSIMAASSQLRNKAEIRWDDNPVNLVDRYELTTLLEIEKSGLTTADLEVAPWSDDYWPFYLGTLARRYADPNFPDSFDWRTNVLYILGSDWNDVQDLNQLSPAEKYDLLVGDYDRTLTNSMIHDGSPYYNANGSVDTWMGICSGWAPASFSIERPTKAIDLLAQDGKTIIRFFPSDIKALASLLWDRAPGPIRFIGGRCEIGQPEVDGNGRPIAGECLDTNPGAWHLSVVNQIGLSKRGLIMDTTYDYQVWNQPIFGYSYTYFNPQTRRTVSSLNEAYVAIGNFTNDVFARYRSSRTAFVAGVVMDVVYMSETTPTQALANTSDDDIKVAVRYFYDLELDRHGNIVGGEWYQEAHPDFLWTTEKGANPISNGDISLNDAGNTANWNTQMVVPGSWASAARQASQYGQPLSRIVDAMVKRSNVP